MRKALYLLGILSDTDIEWLANNGHVQTLKPGEIIITEGTPVDSLFFVLSGTLQVFSRDLQIAVLRSGEIVGEISFVDSRSPLASVRALSEARTLAIKAEVLNVKLAKDPTFASRFYRAVALFLADRLRITTSRLGYGSVGQDSVSIEDPEELHPELLDSVDLAVTRFDALLKRVSTVSH